MEDLNALVAAGRKLHAIYADPPWAFEVYSGKGKQRSAERGSSIECNGPKDRCGAKRHPPTRAHRTALRAATGG